jgi:hypothetical protein
MAPASNTRIIWLGLAACLVLAGILSFYASNAPDGLQRVATDLGLAASAQQSPVSGAPVAGYEIAGRGDRLGTGLAGVLGVAVTAAAAFGLFRALARRGPGNPTHPRSPASAASPASGSS